MFGRTKQKQKSKPAPPKKPTLSQYMGLDHLINKWQKVLNDGKKSKKTHIRITLDYFEGMINELNQVRDRLNA